MILYNVSFTEKAWQFGYLGRNNMTHYQRNITDSIRRLICCLSGGNISGFVLSILSETEQLSLSKTKPILDVINSFVCKDNVQDGKQCNLYHHIYHLKL